MLFLHQTRAGVSYFFQNSFAQKVHFDPNSFLYRSDGVADIASKAKYIVGNDIEIAQMRGYLTVAEHKVIDVCKYGNINAMLTEMGLAAVTKIYNEWVTHDSEILSYEKPRGEYWKEPLPERHTVEKINVIGYKNKFNTVYKYLRSADDSSWIGITWPTCHYLADHDPYIYVYRRMYRTTMRSRFMKPVNKLI